MDGPTDFDVRGAPVVKFQVNRDVFSEAVSFAVKLLPQRTTLPILSGVLHRGNGRRSSRCRRSTTRFGATEIEAEVDEPGTILVSGRLLAEIASRLPNAPVQFSTKTAGSSSAADRRDFTLLSMPVEEYPALPAVAEQTGLVPAEDFATAVAQVARRRIPRRCHPGDHRRAARGRRQQPLASSPPTATASRCARSTGIRRIDVGRGSHRAGSGAHAHRDRQDLRSQRHHLGRDHQQRRPRAHRVHAPTRRPSPRC